MHVLQLQQAFMMGHEDGFMKAICQLALFSPKIDLAKFNVLKDVKDEELVIESQKDNFKEASDSETISKAGDAEATSNSVLTLDPPITYFT